ncbi:MAG: hypothetical protein E6Q88_06955 [Lysobacteraceae bacterium]|nr:MAG: hypothetical protein E6Q88_06955 [Xanthomonadaceae bacterium]
MGLKTWTWWGLTILSGCTLWLLLAGPGHLLGIETSWLGMGLLPLVTWAMFYAVSRIPREDLVGSASPAEWHARIGIGFNLIAMIYFFAHMPDFNNADLPQNPEAVAVGRNLVLMLIAWAAIAYILAGRWKGVAEDDERDCEIAAEAAAWGRGALIFAVIGIVVMLGLTPSSKLEWATPTMIGNLLVFALMWGWFCEYAATLAYYWRDRRG